MPASSTTLPHLTRSDLDQRGVLLRRSALYLDAGSFQLRPDIGSFSAALISAFSFATMALGMPAGARNPPLVFASLPRN